MFWIFGFAQDRILKTVLVVYKADTKPLGAPAHQEAATEAAAWPGRVGNIKPPASHRRREESWVPSGARRVTRVRPLHRA